MALTIYFFICYNECNEVGARRGMMKIVVAIDSFKGSASSRDLNAAVAGVVQDVLPGAEVKSFAIADGGEGTLDALKDGLGGEMRAVETVDLLGRPIEAFYLQIGHQAFIESASVVGIDKICPSSKTFEEASSYGLGALICDAVEQGSEEIYVTLGGSGSSDGGLGLLESFGFDGKTLRFSLPANWEKVQLVGLTDVQNPYAGQAGFARVFGKQKGGNPEQLLLKDRAAREFVAFVEKETGLDLQAIPGTGAAGGLGAALVLLGGRLEAGFDRVASIVGLEEAMADADLVITGEGRLDSQSRAGKVPYGVAQLAKKQGIPAIAVCGAIAEDADWIWEDFLSVFSIQTRVLPLEEAMEPEKTLANLAFVTRNILRTFVGTS